MKKEVQSAVDFITNLLSKRVTAEQVTEFNQSLEGVLVSHYEDHWFPEKPFKGSGYRCIRIVNRKMDPLIARAGAKCGLSAAELLNILPSELTLWIDPLEVSYRIGEDGSIGVLYELEKNSQPSSSADFESDDSTSSGSLSSSPSLSQEYLSFQQQACKNQSMLYFPGMPHPSQFEDDHFQQRSWGEYIATFVAS